MTENAVRIFAHIDGHHRCRLLDQAVADIRALDPRPCGRPDCPVDCPACTAAGLDHLLVLMRADAAVVAVAKAAQNT